MITSDEARTLSKEAKVEAEKKANEAIRNAVDNCIKEACKKGSFNTAFLVNGEYPYSIESQDIYRVAGQEITKTALKDLLQELVSQGFQVVVNYVGIMSENGHCNCKIAVGINWGDNDIVREFYSYCEGHDAASGSNTYKETKELMKEFGLEE